MVSLSVISSSALSKFHLIVKSFQSTNINRNSETDRATLVCLVHA